MPLQTSSSSSPVVESSDGVLSKVCGSLVEPEAKRQQWACHGCGLVFRRDATIYVAPSAPSGAPPNRNKLLEGGRQEHYCRPCYSSLFSMGACVACGDPVLGSTKEDGKFVKASSGDIWHGRCWKCAECGEANADTVSLGMAGLPTCEACFDDTPARRKHVVQAAQAQQPSSPQRRGRRISPPTALSGSASRNGMGPAIAELSKRFGKAMPSPVLASEVTPGNSDNKSHARSNSLSGRVRPLTAQFSGQGFNLAAFQPSTPTLGRSDSRSRSVSPDKRYSAEKPSMCAKCQQGPFDGPERGGQEATMITLPRERLSFHPACFCCAVCAQRMDDSTRSFVRLAEASYAHPACAPPAPVSRPTTLTPPVSACMSRTSSSNTLSDHATHQRETRPSLSHDTSPAPLPTSYLSGAAPPDPLAPHAPKRFQSSAGAAPPTRSTLLHQRASQANNTHTNMASLAVSSGKPSSRDQPGKFSKLGGMNICGGCSLSVSGLEGVPGPRGMRWHKKCLICSSKSRGGKLCGKSLDSSARVDEQGQVRCRQCFDCENSPHPLRA